MRNVGRQIDFGGGFGLASALEISAMLQWWRKIRDRKRLAKSLAMEDARLLIARFGMRASQEANRRMVEMRRGAVFDSNRPACHWRRVLSLTRQLLPYDEIEAIALPAPQDSNDLPLAS